MAYYSYNIVKKHTTFKKNNNINNNKCNKRIDNNYNKSWLIAVYYKPHPHL